MSSFFCCCFVVIQFQSNKQHSHSMGICFRWQINLYLKKNYTENQKYPNRMNEKCELKTNNIENGKKTRLQFRIVTMEIWWSGFNLIFHSQVLIPLFFFALSPFSLFHTHTSPVSVLQKCYKLRTKLITDTFFQGMDILKSTYLH